jgi:hypothetical protein
METLTDRERTIVFTLIKHNGEMTQANLTYETKIPKSSLMGILRTLERRQIIRMKEWGRTNVIELPEWFLSKKMKVMNGLNGYRNDPFCVPFLNRSREG